MTRPLTTAEKLEVIDDAVDRLVERVNDHSREFREIHVLLGEIMGLLRRNGLVGGESPDQGGGPR